MICVTPAQEANAVSQQTVLNGESVLDEIVAADGTRALARTDCAGARAAPSGLGLAGSSSRAAP